VSPLDRLNEAGRNLSEWRDFRKPRSKPAFEREETIELLVSVVAEISDLSETAENQWDYLYKGLEPVRHFSDSVKRAEAWSRRDHDRLEAGLVDLLAQLRRDKRKGRGRYGRSISRDQLLSLREALLSKLESFAELANADLAAELQSELFELVGRFEERKRKSGSLDFVDLLIKTRDLIKGNVEVRTYLQQRFSHIFVDEFQDTDPLQTEILFLLSSNDGDVTDWRQVRPFPGKLFLVGDPKQSIYRFRRADVRLYQQVKGVLKAAGVEIISLSKNFRSVRPVQQAVNGAFDREMKEDEKAGQPGYVPLLEHLPGNEHQPSLIALPVPHPFGAHQISRIKVEDCLPDAVAAFVDWILSDNCGWTVNDPEDANLRVPIEPRHVTILFRRFMSWGRDVTRPYVRGLDARGVPHVLVGSRTFHQREEIETIRAALTAVEWPGDQLSVYATLRGALFAISDAALLRFTKEVGSLHPFRTIPEDLDDDLKPVAEALRLLADLARERNRRPIVQTIHELLSYTRAHAGFALRPAGSQVLANVQRLCDLARRFEMSGGLSFRGFVDKISDEAQKPQSSEAPILEEGVQGVRIMTLHSAKGLESPVVILADITCRLAHSSPDKHVDIDENLCAMRLLGCSPVELVDNAEEELKRDKAEGVRVAYVAATRARDILVVPGVGTEAIEGWLSPLNKAIYPEHGERRNPRPAPGCPQFAEETILSQPYKQQGLPKSSIRPGLHKPQNGAHSVVWWDPALLSEPGEQNFGVWQQDILAEDPEKMQASKNAERYDLWRTRREDTIKDGSLASISILSPSSELESAGSFEPVQIETLSYRGPRPSGRRFGTLVHTVMRDVQLDADITAISNLVAYQARLLGSTTNEIAGATEAVRATLAHPLLHRAANSTETFREMPILAHLEDGKILDGVIDLAFREESNWCVVDFKTDLTLNADRHERQVQWYVYALSRLVTGSVSGWILGV
jgi:ATP-dependent exoDNAse (exonuclease V) beta subunit